MLEEFCEVHVGMLVSTAHPKGAHYNGRNYGLLLVWRDRIHERPIAMHPRTMKLRSIFAAAAMAVACGNSQSSSTPRKSDTDAGDGGRGMAGASGRGGSAGSNAAGGKAPGAAGGVPSTSGGSGATPTGAIGGDSGASNGGSPAAGGMRTGPDSIAGQGGDEAGAFSASGEAGMSAETSGGAGGSPFGGAGGSTAGIPGAPDGGMSGTAASGASGIGGGASGGGGAGGTSNAGTSGAAGGSGGAPSVCIPGHVCRLAVGPCDAPEICSSEGTCPADTFSTGNVCRAAKGPCDVPETCDGTSAACPSEDLKKPAYAECEDGGDYSICTLDECDGVSDDCTYFPPAPAGTLCGSLPGCYYDNDELGQLILSETACDGISPTCPPDVFTPCNGLCNADQSGCAE